ncbi:MAG: calcium-binding protein, partial [Rariglobus sp.]
NMGLVNISGNFEFLINTGGQDVRVNTSTGEVTIGGSAVAGEIVIGGNTFKVQVAATLRIWVFSIEGTLTITKQPAYFEVAVNNLRLDFFGIASLNINGYIRSNGEWRITGAFDFRISLGPVYFAAGFSLTLANTGFSATAYARVGVKINLPWPLPDIDISIGVSVSVSFDIPKSEARFTFSIWKFSHTIVWRFGNPPILATVLADGVLRLNMGVDAHHRGTSYGSDNDETFTVSGNGSTVTVTGLGYSQTYTGVNKILVNNAGAGNDSVTVTGFNGPVEMNGGVGDNILISLGTGSVIARAGDGNNTIITGDGTDTITVGNGNNEVSTGGGSDIIRVGNGNNTINGGAGNDTIYLGTGNNIAYGEGPELRSDFVGNDTFHIYGGTNTLHGGYGNDTYIFYGNWGNTTIVETDLAGDIDTVDFSNTGAPLTFNLGANNRNRITAGSNVLTETGFRLERFIGGSGADIYNVTRSNATTASYISLMGRGGNDTYNVTFGSLTSVVTVDDAGVAADRDYLFVTTTSSADVTVTDWVGDAKIKQGSQEVNYSSVFDNVDRLRILATSSTVNFGYVNGSPLEVLNLKADVTVAAASIVWNGRLRATSFDFLSASGYLIGHDLLAQNNGYITLVTTSGNIQLNAGLYSASGNDGGTGTGSTVGNGNGTITLTTSTGAILTNGFGWNYINDPVKLDWALRLARYNASTVNLDTGHITTTGANSAEQSLYLPNGTVIRNANGAIIQSTGGRLNLSAPLGIGSNMAGFLISPTGLFTHVASFTANVLAGKVVFLVEIDNITNIASSAGGQVSVVSLLGRQDTPAPINTDDQVNIIGDQLNITTPITTSNSIFVRPTDPTRTLYIVQNENGVLNGLVLSQAELNNLITSSTVFFGSGDLRTPIIIGSANATGAIRFNNPTTVLRADFINIHSPLIAQHLIIYGDGSTVHLAADLTVVTGLVDDSVVVSGIRAILSDNDFTITGPIDGDSTGTADDLSITAGNDLNLDGPIGS